jgi:nucleoside-diphosphate-sugar epimerase
MIGSHLIERLSSAKGRKHHRFLLQTYDRHEGNRRQCHICRADVRYFQNVYAWSNTQTEVIYHCSPELSCFLDKTQETLETNVIGTQICLRR